MYYNPLLLIDFYKSTHHEQYPVGLTKMVSYYTPRMSRLKDTDKVTLFGLQAFIKEYLIKGFQDNFFNLPEEQVVADYERVLNATLGEGAYESQKIRELHQLGYLPLEIRAVPEGSRTAIGVPQIEISNTHPNFVWLVNTIETMLSCSMWHTQVSAEVGYRYWQIVKKYWELSCDSSVNPRRLLGDFSMRGQQSVESAIKSSAAWCLSFYNTATVPAILWLEDNYNCDCEKDAIAYGAISTEHSVMCSNAAVDGDEITHIKRLLTEIYPNHSFSMVSDSYDYWHLVTELLPQCKKEIMTHNGCISIRGDSGDPVEIIAGKKIIEMNNIIFNYDYEDVIKTLSQWAFDKGVDKENSYYMQQPDGKIFLVNFIPVWDGENGEYNWVEGGEYPFVEEYKISWKEVQPDAELMGTVWALWQEFGGTINEKGYKVLDSHVKAIYGDSITPQRCKEIYQRLLDKGFAISNVSLGVGSFSMMCLEENGQFSPYTRDTFGIAVKATYAEDKDGNPIMIYKQPKALSWKKSQKGCCIVAPDGQNYTDGHTYKDAFENENLLTTVFKDGKMEKEYTLAEVRKIMYSEET
jgi:nicotinic acid phosphoribosyltransferase